MSEESRIRLASFHLVEAADELRSLSKRASILRRLLQALPGPIEDWKLEGFSIEVAEDAARHGVLAMIASALDSKSVLAPEVEALVRSTRLTLGYRAERARRTFELALEVLAREGISSLPLNGRSLALRLFGDAGVRPSSDVDLLVVPEDLDRAWAALERSGFSLLSSTDPRQYLREHHHLFFNAPGNLPPLELHFGLLSEIGRGLNAGDVLARSHLERIGGREVAVMSREDEFVYLAAHAAGHAFNPMRMLVDLKLLTAKGLDSDRVWQLAREARVELALATAIRLSAHWTGLDMPVRGRLAWRAPVGRAVFCEPLMLHGFFAAHRRSTGWATRALLNDEILYSSRLFLRKVGRAIRRGMASRLVGAFVVGIGSAIVAVHS